MHGLRLHVTSLAFGAISLGISAGQDAAPGSFDGFYARMSLEYGHLWSGEERRALATNTVSSTPLNLVALNRNIVTLDYRGRADGGWSYAAGLKGILWWPFTTEIGEPGSRTVRVEPHLSVLRARKSFGEVPDRDFVELGFLPYKYNRDARNLGEYLYRSGTYPGDLVTTDGYQLMDHAQHDAFGLHARLAHGEGVVTHDFNLFAEAFLAPIGDLTPAYELGVNLPVVQFGFGAAWNRGISLRPSQARPRGEENMYIEVPEDPARGFAYYKGPFLGAPPEAREDTSAHRVLHRWTQRGWKLMARAAVDAGGLLPEELSSPEDLRFFVEAAVLGVENQPYYYDTLAHRIPVMFGVNLPTFRLLQILSVQAEYYGSRFNNVANLDRVSAPVWTVANYRTRDLDTHAPNKWRWSVYGSRSINRLLDLKFQVASDHLRLRNVLSTRSYYDLTLDPKDWYYLLKLELGV